MNRATDFGLFRVAVAIFSARSRTPRRICGSLGGRGPRDLLRSPGSQFQLQRTILIRCKERVLLRAIIILSKSGTRRLNRRRSTRISSKNSAKQADGNDRLNWPRKLRRVVSIPWYRIIGCHRFRFRNLAFVRVAWLVGHWDVIHKRGSRTLSKLTPHSGLLVRNSFWVAAIREGTSIRSQIETTVRCRTAVFSACFAPLLRRVSRLFSAHVFLPSPVAFPAALAPSGAFGK